MSKNFVNMTSNLLTAEKNLPNIEFAVCIYKISHKNGPAENTGKQTDEYYFRNYFTTLCQRTRKNQMMEPAIVISIINYNLTCKLALLKTRIFKDLG